MKTLRRGFRDRYRAYRSKTLAFRFIVTTGAVLCGLLLLLFGLVALLTGDAGVALSVLIGATPPFPPHAAWAAWAAVPLAILGWIAVPVLLASVYSLIVDEAVVARVKKLKKLLHDEEEEAGGTSGM